MNRGHFGHRRNNPAKGPSSTPLTNRTNIDFRNSASPDFKLNFDTDPPHPSRYSFDTEVHLPRREELHSQPKNSYDNIRNTLTELKRKL
jgi:hypothetical protein